MIQFREDLWQNAITVGLTFKKGLDIEERSELVTAVEPIMENEVCHLAARVDED